MNKFFLIVLLAFAMAGCQSYKKVRYLGEPDGYVFMHEHADVK